MTSSRSCGVALALAASLLASSAGAEGLGTRLDHLAGRWLSPGPLAAAHADQDGISQCTSCHSATRGVPAARCLSCHEEIEERRRAGAGVHAGFVGECRTCHAEHRGRDADLLGLDRDAFNHERARFPLRGAHASVDCEACHRRPDAQTGRTAFRPFPVAFERCADCHADPHPARLSRGRDCGACHGEEAFAPATAQRPASASSEAFDHARDARFPLDGRHAEAPCLGCHTTERRRAADAAMRPPGQGVPRGCAGCHEDVHAGALAPDCGTCHGAVAWKGPDSPFDHARQTRFPLDVTHQGVSCGGCHPDAGFAAAARTCEGCHATAASLLTGERGAVRTDPDPHHGVVPCTGCHPADAPPARLVDRAQACRDCHAPEYAALLVERKRILDAWELRAEGAVRGAELAARRGEPARPVAPGLRVEIRELGASGLHHPELAEAVLREMVGLLEASPTGSGSR